MEIKERGKMNTKKKKIELEASVKSFITAMAVIFLMMVLTYALTFIIPGGGIPFWKWALSPVLVLFGEDSGSLIAIIALLVVLGGLFNTLDKFGVLRFLLDKITERFGKSRRILLAVILSLILFILLILLLGPICYKASGIFREDAMNIVGNGVVLDPIIFREECEKLEAIGVPVRERVVIAKKAHLILPTHRTLDAASEASKGKSKIPKPSQGRL